MATRRRWTCLAGLLLGLASELAAAQATEVLRCQADLKPFVPEKMAILITRTGAGLLQAWIDGKVTNADVKAEDHAIRPKLNLRTDPYSAEMRELNAAEISLVHLNTLLSDKNLGRALKGNIPYQPHQVAKMRIYDLQGRQDKFGGTVLMEGYDRNGKLLGRVFRSLFVAGCY